MVEDTLAAAPTGVLLLGYGGPRTLDEVAPFVTAITGGRPLPPAAMAESRRRYQLIGGGSPLPAITEALVEALEKRLAAGGQPCAVAAGMLFARPSLAEAVAALAARGVRRAVAIALVPQYSAATVGRYLARLADEVAAAGQPFTLAPVRSWATHPQLVAAFAEQVQAALATLPPAERAAAQVVFTAHSVPLAMLPEGDTYEQELRATAAAIARQVGLSNWQLAYQSAGRGGGVWFGPTLQETVEALAAAGRRVIVVVPVHFLADNLEILYDIDMALQEQATRLGVRLVRSQSLNVSPLLVEALADLVQERLKHKGTRTPGHQDE